MFRRAATRRVVLTHRGGLHARPSLAIVKKAREFRAKITLRVGTEEVDASDILQIMSLGADCGEALTLTAQGPDAEEALDALEQLITSDFGIHET